MKYLIIVFTFLIIASLDLAAQDDFPLNLNGAYILDSKGFRAIKTTKTYGKGDYHAETINYFDDKGLNFLAESYFKGVKQAKVNLFYSSHNKLKGYKYFYAGKNDEDEAVLAWENEYIYNQKGNIEKGVNLWYNDEKKPTDRTVIYFKYDSLNRVTEEVEEWRDLSESQYYVYFEPNSTEISSNQEIQRTSTNNRIYEYSGDTIFIKNYREKEHKTDQIIIRIDNVKTEVLKTTLGDTLRTTTTIFNDNNQKVEEVALGDTEVSIFGGYGDGMSYDKKRYEYNESGLLSRIVYINSEYDAKMFIDYEYLK